MKKRYFTLIVLLLVFSLSNCGGDRFSGTYQVVGSNEVVSITKEGKIYKLSGLEDAPTDFTLTTSGELYGFIPDPRKESHHMDALTISAHDKDELTIVWINDPLNAGRDQFDLLLKRIPNP